MWFQILLLTFVLVAHARPQEYDDYEQQTARPASRNQQFQQQQQPLKKGKVEDRETTTYIPIIQYDKEQGTDGSYKTQWVKLSWKFDQQIQRFFISS